MDNIDRLFDLTGKVAIVTGGGDGIGRGACNILAAAGASVMVSDLSADKARTTADEITAQGGIATAIACNVLEDGDLVRLVEKTIDIYGTVEALSAYSAAYGRIRLWQHHQHNLHQQYKYRAQYGHIRLVKSRINTSFSQSRF